MLQKAPIGKFEHQSGKTDPGVERFAPVEVGGVERVAPPETANWGESPHSVMAVTAPPVREPSRFLTPRRWLTGAIAANVSAIRPQTQADACAMALKPRGSGQSPLAKTGPSTHEFG